MVKNTANICTLDGEVYVKRGSILPRYSLTHESYHLKNNHDSIELNAEDFADSEIGAHIYTYEKTGEPKTIIKELRAIYNILIGSRYGLSESEAVHVISSELSDSSAPKKWMSDLVRLKKEANFF